MQPVLKLMGDEESRRAAERLKRLAKALGDRFTIERPIGAGAVATVYLARSVKHKRAVAIKVLRGELTPTLAADRFLREIEIAAGLAHPHILPLYQSGEAGGSFYYVMPYAEEGSLRNRLDREGPFPLDVAIRITTQVADALSAAHKYGVVHRDIKPENILFEAGHAVVADFGIAHAVNVSGGERLTETGFAVGTPEYMSPEQSCGDTDVDGRSDLYSLGCVLYEMLAGQPPFVGPNARAVWARHMIDPVPPLTTVRPGLPPPLVRAVNRALAKAPADRFATVADFMAALTTPGGIDHEPVVKSIAVLPFANMSGNPDDEYLSDGISEEIINALTKVEGLNVVARTSAFAFKGRNQDIREIGKQMNVRSVMEGSMRRAGNRLRISAQLVNVADGYHLWSERFDREMEDVFAIQDEIAENVARALRVILSEEERRAIAKAPTASIKAYELYLRGRQFFHQSRKKSLEYARQMFLRAIEVDPNYALAYAGVADCCSLLNMYYPATDVDLTEADEASRRALELDPQLPEAHAARGFVLFRRGDHEGAKREFETAIRLDPRQFEAHYFYARSRFQEGNLEHAADLFGRAAQIRDDYQARFFEAQSLAGLGRRDKADTAYQKALGVVQRHLELNPDDPRAATMCAVSLLRLGRTAEALDWASRAVAIDPDDAGVQYNVACLYALAGEADKAIGCLEESVRKGFGNREWIKRDPDLDALRNDPRFRSLFPSV